MRAASSVVSLTTHVMVVVAALWATAGVHARPPQPPIIVPMGPSPTTERDLPAPGAPVIEGGFTLPDIPLPHVEGSVADLPRVTFDPRHEMSCR